ncbi:hypothetical protein [Micromonospora arida]
MNVQLPPDRAPLFLAFLGLWVRRRILVDRETSGIILGTVALLRRDALPGKSKILHRDAEVLGKELPVERERIRDPQLPPADLVGGYGQPLPARYPRRFNPSATSC